MAKIDEIKEEIGTIKTYLGFIIAFIITIGAWDCQSLFG